MNRILIRFFDILFSVAGLLVLFPVFLIIGCCIAVDSRGGIFFRQVRVGKDNKDFTLYKFRTMRLHGQGSLLTVGGDDPRITAIGRKLRAWKIDELPQLWNVLTGSMSLVGPRPEVRKYVDLYTPEQRQVLSVRPGITDYASIAYRDENEVLARSSNPETIYVDQIMPRKIQMNMKFIEAPTLRNYFSIILKTAQKILA